jgi:hypothetical protein
MDRISSGLFFVAKSSARPAAATDAAAATLAILPSLGASGTIYSTVIMSALAFLEAEISLIFPPTPSFPIQYEVGGLVLLDCIGILRWKYDCTPRPIWLFKDCADDSVGLTGSLTIIRI